MNADRKTAIEGILAREDKENIPLKLNIRQLSASLESTRDQTLKMPYWLEKQPYSFYWQTN